LNIATLSAQTVAGYDEFSIFAPVYIFPLIIYSKSLKCTNLKTIDGFGVVCNTALSLFGINEQLEGENVYNLIRQ
jgi:hypothetical protein